MAGTGISAVKDAVVAKVAAAWGPTAPSGVQGVSRIHPDMIDLPGRQVYVLRLAETLVPEDRGEDLLEYTLGIWILEKYPDDGPVPEPWVDERVKWVEWLHQTLADRRGPRLLEAEGEPDSGLWPETAEILQVCDPKALGEHAAFSATLAVAYREVAPAGAGSQP